MASLTGMSGDIKGKAFDLDRDETKIGRGSSNHIVLDHPTVSGHHCSVIREGERYLVRDLGSTNGTRLNGKSIKESPLKPKDVIQAGSVEFLFDAAGADYPRDLGDFSDTQVEIAPGPAAAPQTFNTISPFGAKRREGGKGLWYALIALIGVLALAAVIYLFIKLMAAG
jgi:hypothetical protein